MRDNQKIEFTRLDSLHRADVGMPTVLFIGSSASVHYMDFIYTPRGYHRQVCCFTDSFGSKTVREADMKGYVQVYTGDGKGRNNCRAWG
ncbi:MAG: hypothetical protein U5K27_02700 [Desulfotignum sp.]|nr:hypothetical protein [Desulfotignum sp.]